MDAQFVDGDFAYILWTGETAENVYELGTDTFVVREGRDRGSVVRRKDCAQELMRSARVRVEGTGELRLETKRERRGITHLAAGTTLARAGRDRAERRRRTQIQALERTQQAVRPRLKQGE